MGTQKSQEPTYPLHSAAERERDSLRTQLEAAERTIAFAERMSQAKEDCILEQRAKLEALTEAMREIEYHAPEYSFPKKIARDALRKLDSQP